MNDSADWSSFDRWPARHLWPPFCLLLLLALAAAFVWQSGRWAYLIAIWPAMGYCLFVLILAFHDASHGRLHPVPWLNEVVGNVIGGMSFVPLSVYRYAHGMHHAHLASPRDPELWPFTQPSTSRMTRVLAAISEIVFGCLYSPLLFLRAVVVGEVSDAERRSIRRSYCVCLVFWTVKLGVIHYFQLWDYFLALVVGPMVIAGQLQTLNKYMQHIGLHGRTVLGLTRTVVDRTAVTKGLSASLMYNDYHGTHHRYAKIPYYHLPAATPPTLEQSDESAPVFPHVFAAVRDMLPCLADPKTGAQWNVEGTSAESPERSSVIA